jgi:hypothetical protein
MLLVTTLNTLLFKVSAGRTSNPVRGYFTFSRKQRVKAQNEEVKCIESLVH